MKVLIAGGSGFLGSAMSKSLLADGHQVTILTRRSAQLASHIHWDGKTTNGWGSLVNEMDVVVNLSGLGLEHWPWTRRQKERFINSRILPGHALVSAIQNATHRPRVFLQASGINYYGLRGDNVANESTPPADDFLSRLSVNWENATRQVDDLGVRRVVVRSAVVLDRRGGLFPLMALPARLFFGGKFGDGTQAMNWIHLEDHVSAMRYLVENGNASGPFNLVSPEPTSNADFMRNISIILHRPYWFHIPAFLLRMVMGEMSILLSEGRYSQPRRLIESGFKFRFGKLDEAMRNLLS